MSVRKKMKKRFKNVEEEAISLEEDYLKVQQLPEPPFKSGREREYEIILLRRIKIERDRVPLIRIPTSPEEPTLEEKELQWFWKADDEEPQPRTPDVDMKADHQRATSSKM